MRGKSLSWVEGKGVKGVGFIEEGVLGKERRGERKGDEGKDKKTVQDG